MGDAAPTLLQIYLSDEDLKARLIMTATESYRNRNENLLNCANLVLVLLDLVVDPKNYLSKCAARERETDMHELNTITKEAFARAGVPYTGTTANIEQVNIQLPLTFLKVLQLIAQELQRGYATPIGVQFQNEARHFILLRKRMDGIIELIDPQSVNKSIFATERYPLRHAFRDNSILMPNPYGLGAGMSITTVYFFKGPSLNEAQARAAKSTLSRNIMNEAAGKRKGGKRTSKTRHRRRRA
jgi:hypothetical protein